MADDSAADKHDLLLVAIGSSPDAIEALKDLLSCVETDGGTVCAIAIPLWAGRDSNLARVLRTELPLPVTQPDQIVRVDSEGIYLFSPDKYLVAINDVLKMLGADSGRIDKIVAGGGGLPELEQELQRMRGHLRAAEERNQTTSDELRAITEDMRAATEALQTGKQTLEAVSQELATLNQNCSQKVEEAARAQSDLRNLLAAAESATIFLDCAFCVYLYTPRAQQLLNITPADIGHSFGRFASQLNYNELEADGARVMRALTTIERQLQAANGRRYRLRIAPYRTTDDRIEGVVLRLHNLAEAR